MSLPQPIPDELNYAFSSERTDSCVGRRMLAVDITTEKSAELVLTVNVGDSGLDTRQQIYLISWFAKDDTIGSCSFTSLQRTGKLQKRDMQQSFKYEQFLYNLYIMNRSLVVLIMYILVHHSYMPPQCIFQEYPRQSRTVDDYMGVYTPTPHPTPHPAPSRTHTLTNISTTALPSKHTSLSFKLPILQYPSLHNNTASSTNAVSFLISPPP